MMALVMKDFASIRRSLLLTLLLSVGIGAYGIYQETYIMIPALCAMLPLIMSSITFGSDYKANFEQLLFSLPVKKRDYVLSKLSFAFLFGAIGSVVVFGLFYFKSQLPLDVSCLVTVLTFSVTLIISAVHLPFILKFGAEKGRLLMVLTYFVLFSGVTALKEQLINFERLWQWASAFSTWGLVGVTVLLTVGVVGSLMGLSVQIVQKKEYS